MKTINSAAPGSLGAAGAGRGTIPSIHRAAPAEAANSISTFGVPATAVAGARTAEAVTRNTISHPNSY